MEGTRLLVQSLAPYSKRVCVCGYVCVHAHIFKRQIRGGRKGLLQTNIQIIMINIYQTHKENNNTSHAVKGTRTWRPSGKPLNNTAPKH